MKAYKVKAGARCLDDLSILDMPAPEPGVGEVLVRVHATSLNFRDQAIVMGLYLGGPIAQDTIALSDGAGEVVAVGAGVTRFKPGDRVAGIFFQNWIDGPSTSEPKLALGSPVDGMLAEYRALPEHGLVKLPAHLSYEQGACLPCAAVTAWNALADANPIRPGQTVLLMGTGGVSIFGLQFAKAMGARTVVTSSSDEKLERAKTLGADHTINYKTHPEWAQEVLRLTDGEGADHVLEVGGIGTLAQSFQAVAHGGTISYIGVLAGKEGDTSPHMLLVKGARLQGIFVGSRRMFEDMNEAVSVNAIIPVIDRVFAFDEVKDAFAHQLAGKHFGKVVIRVD